MSFYKWLRPVTIDHTKCGTDDVLGFPMLFQGLYTYLATQTFGGVLNTHGVDLMFFADQQQTIPIPWERLYYDETSGQISAWLQIPQLHANVDTTIWMAYGNPTLAWDGDDTTWNYNIGTGINPRRWRTTASPWDQNYRFVMHFAEYNGVFRLGLSTGFSEWDASTNAQSLAFVTSSPTQVTGPLGLANTAAQWNGAVSMRLWTGGWGTSAWLLGSTDITIEAWVNTSNFNQQKAIVSAKPNNGTERWGLICNSDSDGAIVMNGNSTVFTTGGARVPAANISNSAWHRIIGTITGTSCQVYVDNTLYTGTGTAATDTVYTSGGDTLGYELDVGAALTSNFDGALNEVRVSNIVRSASYVTADWNSQSSPSTFYTVGNQIEAQGGGDDINSSGTPVLIGNG